MVTRVAILIDGDNISPVHAPRILALARVSGRIDVHRAYTDATNGSGWGDVPGVRSRLDIDALLRSRGGR